MANRDAHPGWPGRAHRYRHEVERAHSSWYPYGSQHWKGGEPIKCQAKTRPHSYSSIANKSLLLSLLYKLMKELKASWLKLLTSLDVLFDFEK